MPSESRKIRIAAAIIADASGRMLLVRKRGAGAFMQPGGKIEPDEKPVDALVRELLGELAQVVGPARLRGSGCFSAPAVIEPDCRV